jgi:hypothetical protein
MASSTSPSEITAVPRRKAAQDASQKIKSLGLDACQTGGSARHLKKHDAKKNHPFPSLSQVLKMEEFSILEIVDSAEEGVEEEVRVDDEYVFTNPKPLKC